MARSALTKAGTVVVKAAKAPYDETSDDPRHLRDSITKRLRRHRSGSASQEILIGVERPKSRTLHLVEFGTAHSAASSFMRPALDESVTAVLDTERRAMAEGIEREAKKLATKHGTLKKRSTGSRLWYSWWVEHGTARMPAGSRTAADEAGQEALDKLKENLAQGIEREAQKYRGK